MGLLDFMKDPDAQLGLGLLAAASSGKRFGEGLLSASQYADSQRKGDLQQKLLQAQMDNYQSEIEARKLAAVKDARQQAWIEKLMGGAPTQGQGAGFVGAGAPSGSASAAPAGGSQGGGILELARSYGIPEQAVQADMAFNGGKGIAAMLEKRGAPDMQVTNGYAYDRNRLGAGFMPSLTTSQDGKTSMTRIGPDGMPIISAPQGALETFNNYQSAQANYKPIKVYNPGTGREEYTSEGAVVRGAGGGAGGGQQDIRSSAYAGGSRASANQESIQILQMEMQQPGRTQAEKDAISREIARLQFMPKGQAAAPASGNYAAGPSAMETARNEAERTRQVEQAKADVTPTAQKISNIETTRDALGVIDQALQHPGLRVATGISGTLDPRNYIPGTNATNFKVMMDQVKGSVFLDAYKDLRGGGQITEVEGSKAEAAKARINRAQSPEEFIAGLKEYRSILQRGYDRAVQQGKNTGGASGGWGMPAVPAAGGFKILGVE